MNANQNAGQLGIIKASMWLGYLVMLGLGAVMVVYEPTDDDATLAVLFCVVGLEKPTKDERARKIGTLAATYAWFVTLVAMCFVYVWDVAWNLQLSVPRFLGILLLVTVASMAALNFYFGRKGDVE